MAICDGKTAVCMPGAQDHKRALDGDGGLNTGGMGAYAPAPCLTPRLARECAQMCQSTVTAMAAEGSPFVGVLFAGFMLTKEDGPVVLEFNVRMGDPETQVCGSVVSFCFAGYCKGACRRALCGGIEPASVGRRRGGGVGYGMVHGRLFGAGVGVLALTGDVGGGKGWDGRRLLLLKWCRVGRVRLQSMLYTAGWKSQLECFLHVFFLVSHVAHRKKTQVLLPLMESDLYEVMLACTEGRLAETPVSFTPGAAAATVVLAADGYPGKYPKGMPISGLEDAAAIPGVTVFHAGTKAAPPPPSTGTDISTGGGSDGVVSSGGRVLAVTGMGATFAEALDTAYRGVGVVKFSPCHYRTDIGYRAKTAPLRVGVLASGRGTALQAVIDACETGAPAGGVNAEVVLVVTNKKDAPVRERAKKHGIPEVFVSSKVSGRARVCSRVLIWSPRGGLVAHIGLLSRCWLCFLTPQRGFGVFFLCVYFRTWFSRRTGNERLAHATMGAKAATSRYAFFPACTQISGIRTLDATCACLL